MRVAVVTALVAVSLLGACRQSENQANTSTATSPGPADSGSANSAAPPATAVNAKQAQLLFHERHEGMERIGKSTKTIRQSLDSGSGDLGVIRTSAATIADLAAKSSGWFPAGTGEEVLPKTRALPAIWQKPDDFTAKDRNFSQAAQALRAAAESGDMRAIKSRFADLGKTCKACHDTYRAEEHPK